MQENYLGNIKRRQLNTAQNFRDKLSEKWGPKYAAYRDKWNQSSTFKHVSDFPLHIDFDTVDSCNLHCHFCTEEHNFFRKRTHKRLTTEFTEQLFREIKQPAGVDRLCAINIGTLGEPFLYPETVYSILEKSNECNVMEKFIHTNGHLLTLDVFKNLVKLDLTYLFISIDAYTSETYLKMRGADLNRVVDNIMAAVQYKKEHNLTFPVLRTSFLKTELSNPEADAFFNFWQDKVDFIDFQPAIDFTSSIQKSSSEKGRLEQCCQPFQRMTIGVQGELGLCCSGYIMIPEFYVGIFPQMSIYEAWNCTFANKLRAAHCQKDFADFKICSGCLSRTGV
jgi:sulfatase maturation enzyme AslB (radical SAM superfamily)